MRTALHSTRGRVALLRLSFSYSKPGVVSVQATIVRIMDFGAFALFDVEVEAHGKIQVRCRPCPAPRWKLHHGKVNVSVASLRIIFAQKETLRQRLCCEPCPPAPPSRATPLLCTAWRSKTQLQFSCSGSRQSACIVPSCAAALASRVLNPLSRHEILSRHKILI